MPPDLISEAGGLPSQLAFWRDNFIPPPSGSRDGDIEPNPLDPVFLALYPPPDIGARIRNLAWDLRRRYRLRDYPIDCDRLHVSLHHVCDYGDVTPGALMAIGAGCAGVRQPAFRVAFDRVESFVGGRKRALVLRGGDGVDGIRMLHGELSVALGGISVSPPRRRIEPHLTLLYDPREVKEPIPEVGWTVDEFRLVCSLHGRRRHLALARWRLPEVSR